MAEPLIDPSADTPSDGGRATGAADAREVRLSRSLSGTNLARAGDYNMRTVLQAIRLSPETTRVDLAQQTGLTAATIANITGRLADKGLVRVTGRRQGGRGQPPLKLIVNPDGAFGIGITIDRDHLTMVTLDLAGTVRSRVTREIAFALPTDVQAFVREELKLLIQHGGVDRRKVLGIGVAIPDDLGRIALAGRPADYGIWSDTDVGELLAEFGWPVHCDNDAATAALGEAEFGSGFANPSFFYLLISAGLGGGLVIDRSYHRGANNRSGEIGLLPDAGAGEAGGIVQDTVSLSALFRRFATAGHRIATVSDLGRRQETKADHLLDEWVRDSVRALVAPLVSVNCLLNPDAVLIGGRLPLPLIQRLADGLTTALAAIDLPARAPVLPAELAEDASAIGAAILPFLDDLLPSDAILIQAGR